MDKKNIYFYNIGLKLLKKKGRGKIDLVKFGPKEIKNHLKKIEENKNIQKKKIDELSNEINMLKKMSKDFEKIRKSYEEIKICFNFQEIKSLSTDQNKFIQP